MESCREDLNVASLLDRLFGGTSPKKVSESGKNSVSGKTEREVQRRQRVERIPAETEKEDFLLRQIDEFREKAARLQDLLLSKESKVAELQNIVADQEAEAAQLKNVIDDRREAAEVLLTGVQSQMNEMITEVEDKLNNLAEKIASDVNDSTGRTAEQTAEMKADLDKIGKQLDTMKLELAEKIHTEDVKCYRNMADLIAELTKKIEENDELEEGIHSLKGYVMFLSGFAVLNFAAVVVLLLYSFGIFRF